MNNIKSIKRILIVDDDPKLARIIETTLRYAGMDTTIAFSGEDAIKLAREDRPDVILLDMILPDMSGLEVCKTIKTDPITSAIIVIFLSGQTDQDDIVAGITAGADEYLTKPFSPTQLIDLIDKALSEDYIVPQKRESIDAVYRSDQMSIYAFELRELYEKERSERQALQAAHIKLNELENLKATLLNAVTHELLTPFTAVGLALQVLQQHSVWWSEEHRQSLEELSQAIALLHQRINGLVKCAELITKRRGPQRGLYQPYYVVQRSIQPAAVLAQSRGIDFRVLIPHDLPKIHVDPELIGEAVFQIAHNAVKFNKPGGWVRVIALVLDQYIVYEVSDNGIGLTKERLDTLGQPFSYVTQALQRGQEGLGVGWAFAVYVAEVHNGWTHVESSGPDKGSVFRLAVPHSNNNHET
jgi:DNA-binding response OmpR family regulator